MDIWSISRAESSGGKEREEIVVIPRGILVCVLVYVA